MMDTTIIYNDYLSGDAKALERLMEIYGDKLTLYINGYIKNLHDSEDLLIEVFAYLISKRPNIKSSFESYIYKAARNHALMFLRKAKRHIILTEEEMNFCIENTFEDYYLSKPFFFFIIARTFSGRPNRLMKPSLSLWL